MTPVIPPVSLGVSNITIEEGVAYSVTVPIDGSEPMALSMTLSPEGATITGRTITWETECSAVPVRFAVAASNWAGTLVVEWAITVPCPYGAILDASTDQAIPAPAVIELTGATIPSNRGKPVTVIVKTEDEEFAMSVIADDGGNFSLRLQLDLCVS